MGHGHHHPISARRALVLALVLNGAFLLVELVVGLYTGSLSLLSDAAHTVSDVGALALALGAWHLARRTATSHQSYGFLRAETLGAFINGLALVVACGVILKVALERLLFDTAPHIHALPVFAVGLAGLVINLGSAWFLYRSDPGNLNIRGALLHMMTDALGSLASIIAALFLAVGIYAADAVMSLLIVGLVLWATWDLLKDATRVLLQFAPAGLDVEEVRTALLEVPGALDVHDLHVWTLDGQEAILSAHLVAPDLVSTDALREDAETVLREHFGIVHSTLQIEGAGCSHPGCPLVPPPPQAEVPPVH